MKGILIDSSPLEAKYLIKIINGEMRIGLTEGLVEIAISKAFSQDLKQVRDAMLVSGDISNVAFLAKRKLTTYRTNQTTYTYKLHVSRCNVYCRRDNQVLSKDL